MVKRGGTKRKAEMKKITNRASRATTFTKRRDGLYSKAAQLCILSDAQIAIIATPSSSNSNVSFNSFGHSSVDSIVSAYLSGQRLPPVSFNTKEKREDLGICMARQDLGLGFWWDDPKLLDSKNLDEVMEAMASMEVLMKRVEELENQTLKTTTKVHDHEETLPDLDEEWSEMEINQLLQDCDDEAPLVVVSNTDDHKEEEDNDFNAFLSSSSAEDEALYIDMDTVLKVLGSDYGDDINDWEELSELTK